MRYWKNGRFGVICKVLVCLGVAVLLLEPVPLFGQVPSIPGYGGPAVASRGLGRAGQRGSETVSLTAFASVSGTYDTGITAVGLDQQGNIADSGALLGVEVVVGAYGTKTWKRRRLGLDYGGNFRHYTGNSYFDGSDHYLALNYTQQLGRRGALQFSGVGGTTSRALGSNFGYATGYDPAFLTTPLNDIFDNRLYYADFSGRYARQLSPRSSVSLGGGVLSMRRRSTILIGTNGVRANGDFVRRISRNTSIGAGFNYMKLEFPRVFGDSNIQSLSVQLSRNIGRRWSVAASLGAMRLELTGVRQVNLDPVVAELLGQLVGREAFHSINYFSIGSLTILHTMRKSDFSIGYNRGPSIGNGVTLAGKLENFTATYSRVVTSRLHLSTSAYWSNTTGAGSYGGSFQTLAGGVNASYRLTDYASFTLGAQERRIGVGSSQFNRWSTRLNAGIDFRPGSFGLWPK
ncbi:MAG: hypothetical protein HY820_34415 [Acidobacteria bacterium]|nr:hypothetical protein [Acidobacteriota bacterium]